MSEWKQKRFWKAANVLEDADGFTVELDGRRIKTPAKASLILPRRKMADAVAAEWNAQSEIVDPLSMPFTRSANAALDKVHHQHSEVADMLAAYGDADLLCYRADEPAELVERQSEQWDPALNWAEQTLNVHLQPRRGIVHKPQQQDDLNRLSARVHDMTVFQLAGFHDLVSISGSLILGLAAAMNWKDAETIWTLSQLDELWQEQQWGPDEDARAMANTKKNAFLHAKKFFEFS